MDDALRSLERRARAAPDDLTLARALRAGLERAAGAPGVARRLDALHGALCVSSAIGDEEDPGDASAPRWRLVPVGGEAPLLRPALASAARERWRARGRAVWVGADLVLVEGPDGALEGRDASTGAPRWSIPSVGPARLIEEDEARRTARLGWAVAPWGAVEVGARWEAELQVRRTGRWTPHGRTTEREVAGRGAVVAALTLQVVLAPGGTWTEAPPRALVERPAPGGALLGGDLALGRWDDDLLALALDPRAPRFAVRWRDEDQDWAVYEAGLAPDGSPWVGPAGWSAAPDEDPVGLGLPIGGADGGAPAALRPTLRELHEDDRMRALDVLAPHPLAGERLALGPSLAAAAALALDDVVLVRGEPDGAPRLHVLRAGPDAGRVVEPRDDLLPGEVAEHDLLLRFWDEPDAADGSAVVLLPAPGVIVAQVGGEVVGLTA